MIRTISVASHSKLYLLYKKVYTFKKLIYNVKAKKVLGIDPGFGRVGLGLIEKLGKMHYLMLSLLKLKLA